SPGRRSRPEAAQRRVLAWISYSVIGAPHPGTPARAHFIVSAGALVSQAGTGPLDENLAGGLKGCAGWEDCSDNAGAGKLREGATVAAPSAPRWASRDPNRGTCRGPPPRRR